MAHGEGRRQHFLVVALGVQSHVNPGRALAHRLARLRADGSITATLSVPVTTYRRMFPRSADSAPATAETSDGVISYVAHSDGLDRRRLVVVLGRGRRGQGAQAPRERRQPLRRGRSPGRPRPPGDVHRVHDGVASGARRRAGARHPSRRLLAPAGHRPRPLLPLLPRPRRERGRPRRGPGARGARARAAPPPPHALPPVVPHRHVGQRQGHGPHRRVPRAVRVLGPLAAHGAGQHVRRAGAGRARGGEAPPGRGRRWPHGRARHGRPHPPVRPRRRRRQEEVHGVASRSPGRLGGVRVVRERHEARQAADAGDRRRVAPVRAAVLAGRAQGRGRRRRRRHPWPGERHRDAGDGRGLVRPAGGAVAPGGRLLRLALRVELGDGGHGVRRAHRRCAQHVRPADEHVLGRGRVGGRRQRRARRRWRADRGGAGKVH
uniref:Uncharacterized protein n=1 Tax=Zea mays TaxID=4577 RepID=A0A804NYX0_MAIZE